MREPTPSTESDGAAGLDKRQRRERGAALVEFAIVLPLLMLILFGLFEFGFAMYRLQGMHAASRDAARVGSFPSISQPEIRARALSSLDGTLLESQPVVTVTPDLPEPCGGAADEVIVTIEAYDRINVPFWDDITITLNTKAEFACEN